METSASTRRCLCGALVSSLLLCAPVRALDFGNTLTFGELHEPGQPAKLYNSESLAATLDFSDALAWNIDTSATHYLSSATSSAFTIWRLGTGLTWDVDEHLSLDLDGSWSPQSGYTFDDGDGVESYRSTSTGLSLDATYDFQPHDARLDPELLLGASTTRYAGSEAAISSAVIQTRLSAGAAITVRRDTRLELNGSYDVYEGGAHAPGAPDPLGLNTGAAVPIEPLRLALRADLTQKLGDLRLSAYVQGGLYVHDSGESMLAGARLTWVLADSTRLTLGVSYQRMQYAGANPLSIPSLSLGLRLYF